MSKLPCAKCGALILEATAKRNAGLCEPCRTGRREAMDAARKRDQEARERTRFLKLWRSLVRRAHDGDEGITGFSEAEKRFLAVGLLELELYNGGFDQFFFNSSGSHCRRAASGLKEMGALRSLELLRRAQRALFGDMEVPESTAERREFLQKEDSAEVSRELSALDDQYCADPDGLEARMKSYALKHGLI